ncbi:MAG: NADH-ubiquinone oxidoreductase chain G, partial [uncultured Friedmanniella sp.]
DPHLRRGTERGRAPRGPGLPHHRRRRGERAEGHPRHPRRRAGRHPRPALLRPPAARAGRRLPPVPRRGRDARARRRAAHDDGPARAGQAAGVLHAAGLRGDAGQDAAHLRGRRQVAAGRHGGAAHQPPARLPRLRQGRGVPAAEPGDDQRPRRDPVRRAEADLPQADQHLRAGAARPGALCALRPVHPLLRAGRRRPVHRPGRARRAAAGRDLRARALPLELLRQHHPDLPGRCPDLRVVPLPRPALRPGLRAVGRRARLLRLRGPGRPPPRQGRAPARRQRPRGQRGVDHRQGPLRVLVRRAARPAHDAAGPRRGVGGAPGGVVARGVRGRGAGPAGRRTGRRPHRRTADPRGRLRLRQVRPGRARHPRHRLPVPAALRRGSGVPRRPGRRPAGGGDLRVARASH